jgi:hypothetical protein
MSPDRQSPPLTQAVLPQPFDLSRYNLSPLLTPLEQQTLQALVTAFDAKKFNWPPNSREALARLLEPLDDVLHHIQIQRRSRVSAIRLMIRWMNATQQPYWAWSQDAWHHYLVDNARQARFKVARPSVLAFAYCLGGIRCFPSRYALNYYHFASSIFGQDRVRTAVDCVVKELVRWGYQGQNTREYVRRVLSVFFLHVGSTDFAALPPDILSQIDPTQHPHHLYKTAVNISRVLVSLGLVHPPFYSAVLTPADGLNSSAQHPP